MSTVSTGKFIDVLKSILSILDNSIKSLADVGLQVKDRKEDKDGIIYTIYTGENEDIIFKVRVSQSQDDNELFIVHCKDEKNHKENKYIDVKADEIDKKIRDFCEKSYGYDSFAIDSSSNNSCNFNIESSHKFYVSLKRICGSKYDKIQMMSIKCSSAMNIQTIQSNLNVMLDSEDIIDNISENKSSIFEVVDEGDDIDVIPLDAMPENADNDCNQYITILAAAYDLLNVSKSIKWNAKGQEFYEVSNNADSLCWNISSQIDTIGQMCVERCGRVPSPNSIIKTISNDINTSFGFDFSNAIRIMQNSVEDYISALEIFYCNQEHDVQCLIDNWIRDLKSFKDYTLQRKVM